jgi:hypothetical protein
MKVYSRAKKLFSKGGWRKFRLRIAEDRRREREVKKLSKMDYGASAN